MFSSNVPGVAPKAQSSAATGDRPNSGRDGGSTQEPEIRVGMAAAADPAKSAAGSGPGTPGPAIPGTTIQEALDRLEETILDSPRLPFGRRTLVDEERLLDQLDAIRLSLPAAFREAEAIARQRQQILFEAEQRAQDLIDVARQQAARTVEETSLVRQAQLEAETIRQQVDAECGTAREELVIELERLRDEAMAELDQMRQAAIAECEAIQDGADDYADRVLGNIERQLGDMLRIIRNGRQQLQQDSPRHS